MISTDLVIGEVKLIQLLKERNPKLYSGFINVYEKVEPLINVRISQVFRDYTLHNIHHSLRIMVYMEKLVPDIDKLTDFELVLLAYSALLHDIGMATSEEDIQRIKQGELSYGNIKFEALLDKFNGDEVKAIQDYVRRVHAVRSAEYIKDILKMI
ncbi:HD domain-containing protein [Bacillus sp. OVS6]|nr:HD domain-containing protein [Bacillus sp. OVS6]